MNVSTTTSNGDGLFKPKYLQVVDRVVTTTPTYYCSTSIRSYSTTINNHKQEQQEQEQHKQQQKLQDKSKLQNQQDLLRIIKEKQSTPTPTAATTTTTTTLEDIIIEYYQSNVDQITVNETKLMNWDALHWASLYNHTDILNLIIDNRINQQQQFNNNNEIIFKQDKYGVSPLHIAVQQSHLESVDILLERGCQVNVRDTKPGVRLSSLHLALQKQTPNIELIKRLIKHGANVNQETTERKTPLFRACSLANYQVVELLLKNGANINIQDNPRTNGWEPYRVNTPFHIAVSKGNLDIVRLLLDNGGNPNLKLMDEMGETLLHVAAIGDDADIASLLLDRGADPLIPDNRKSTPLDYANTAPPKQNIINLFASRSITK
ncbi:hypothetical protein DFA_01412 [Cavenderia fasciculata]|uniref:Ankyrin repeat-containing protein n=1 Tax=Cavenderia fasciculata TaxID=261658 RepID=F4PSJ6_CACFS|nr:uncharacterized protein DFA_01412 [Cavenderia fasciculata]EGG21526.1 hypothetical protein DFA_01412 [Cavenderia fasciculata]|eukprot:XP_004359376.1 hypothetical protein DFA_01412 [Cavenderia fasciculata]